ncbi:MAG: T9SS type A sorting domain-containing protein [Bacteroidetes bacterium]|nr:T9SS type A sorting domain-containing protein [Bacteroidota bacterium]
MYSSVYAACPACPPHSSGPLAFPYCEGYGRPGYYREDTLARKVYYYDMQRHRDNLTIDYSLNVGDSFYVSYGQGDHYPNHDSGYIYVDSIAWSNFQGDTVKTWYFTNPKVTTLYEPSIMLYEGRGFSYGFFLDYVFADGTGIAGQLSGYCKNSSCWSTCTPTGITDIHAGEYISLFPDPAVKTVFIQSDQAQFLSATLYNTEGKEIKQYYTPSLDIGELSPGLYIARIKTSGGYTFKRFVKTQ